MYLFTIDRWPIGEEKGLLANCIRRMENMYSDLSVMSEDDLLPSKVV